MPLPWPRTSPSVHDGTPGRRRSAAAGRWPSGTWPSGGSPRRSRRAGELSDGAGASTSGAVAFGRGDRLYVGPRPAASARCRREPCGCDVPGCAPGSRRTVGSSSWTRPRLVAGGDRGQLAVDLRASPCCGSPSRTVRRDPAVTTWRCPRGGAATARRTRDGRGARPRHGRDDGRLLEPQLGEIGDSWSRRRGAELLLAFGVDGSRICPWRLDGPGVGGTSARAGRGRDGWVRPTGRLLLVAIPCGFERGRRRDNGASVLRSGCRVAAVWLSRDDGRGARPDGLPGRRPFRERDATRLVVLAALLPRTWRDPRLGRRHARGGIYRLRRFSSSTGWCTRAISARAGVGGRAAHLRGRRPVTSPVQRASGRLGD